MLAQLPVLLVQQRLFLVHLVEPQLIKAHLRLVAAEARARIALGVFRSQVDLGLPADVLVLFDDMDVVVAVWLLQLHGVGPLLGLRGRLQRCQSCVTLIFEIVARLKWVLANHWILDVIERRVRLAGAQGRNASTELLVLAIGDLDVRSTSLVLLGR